MNESVQTIQAADAGIKGVTSLLEAARTLAQSAKQAATNYVKVSVGTISAGTVIAIGGTAYTATAAGVSAASTELRHRDRHPRPHPISLRSSITPRKPSICWPMFQDR